MKFTKGKLLGITALVFVLVGVLACAFVMSGNGLDVAMARSGFVPYHTGDEIVFNQSGNSADYIMDSIGWGKQEPKHRCIVGKNAELKLFIVDSDGSDLRLLFNGFGTREPDAKCQYITVYANDTMVAEWCAASRDIYTAIIPGNLIPDGNLHVRFDIAKPYVGEIDKRPLGAAVRGITVEKIRGNQTKKKLSLWLQTKLWGGHVQNPYAAKDTNTVEQEKSK